MMPASPRLPVLAGGDPLHLFENTREIIGIADADTGSCFLQRNIGEAQELFGCSDAGMDQVISDGCAVLLAEPPHEVILVEVELLRKKSRDRSSA